MDARECAVFLSLVVLVSDVVGSSTSTTIIPPTFPSQDVNSYAIRYLSNTRGSDLEVCLSNQSYLAPAENVSACQTLAFAISGRASVERGNVVFGLNNTIVLVSPGIYSYSAGIEIHNSSGVILAKDPRYEGDVIFSCSSLNETNFNNLYFRMVENVALIGITAVQCGLFTANIVFQYCRQIAVSNCIFKENYSGGMTVDNSLEVLIENSTYQNNSGSSAYISAQQFRVRTNNIGFRIAGGLTLSYRGMSPASQMQVINCSFKNNTAAVNRSNYEDASNRPLFYIPRGHGGGLLLFFENSSYHSFHVENCTFEGNTAQFGGGGATIMFYRGSDVVPQLGMPSSHDNAVAFIGCEFFNNTANHGGGLVGLAFEESTNNNVTVSNCSMRSNHGRRSGGGIATGMTLDSAKTDSIVGPIALHIDKTVFENNLGGALSLLALVNVIQLIIPANITSCTFIGNQHERGAIFSYRFPIVLHGQNRMIGNSMSAMLLVDSKVYCHDEILFEGNSGLLGGAIQMHGNAVLNLFEGLNLTFSRNSASIGGAVRVFRSLGIEIDHIESSDLSCFIRYFNPNTSPTDWKVNISFIGNTATFSGGALFATDVNLCDILTYETEMNNRLSLFNLSSFYFRNNSIMVQSGMAVRSNDISTEAFILNSSLPNGTLVGAPGQTIRFSIWCKDELGMNMSCTYSSNITEGLFYVPQEGMETSVTLKSLDQYLLTESDYLPCFSDVYHTVGTVPVGITLIDINSGEVLNSAILYLNITCCRPGYKLRNNTTCSLDKSNPVVLRRDQDNKFVYIVPQHYAQVRDGRIISAAMPVFYQNCISQGNVIGCLFDQEQPDNQCSNGRRGFLCGTCPNGTSPDLTLTNCVTCYGWHTFLIIVIVLFFTGMSALVMVFNVKLTSEFKGFLFYVQVVGFVYEFGEFTNGQVTWDFQFATFLGINLNFPLCPYPGYNALYTVLLGFILPVVLILTIAVFILSAKFIKPLSNTTSFDGIWLLSFFIYKIIADICFKILKCERVDLNDGSYEYVYSYDGSIKCFSTESPVHLVFTVGALLLSVAVFIFPVFILVISFRRFQLTQNMTDVLNEGIKPSQRWWSSFDLFRRIAITYMVLILSYLSPQYSQLVLLFCNLLIFLVFALATPYTSRRAIYIETAVLLDLIVITGISLNTAARVQKRLRWLSITLLITPYLIIIAYFSVRIIKFVSGFIQCPSTLQQKLTQLRNKVEKLLDFNDEETEDSSSINVLFTAANVPLDEDNISKERSDNSVVFVEPISSNTTTVSFTQLREELLADYSS